MVYLEDDQLLLSDERRDERTLLVEALASRNAWAVELVLTSSLPLVVVGADVALPTDFILLALFLVGATTFYGSKSWYERRM